MIKKVIATSLVAAALVLSACGGSSDGESQLETQQMLDEKDYAGVISKLEAGASTTSDYLALAAAYMGKAGFSLSSVIGIVATSADSDDNSTFATFVENSKSASNSQSLKDMKKAVTYYQKVVPNKCLDANATLSGAESDVCLYVGLSQVSQTAVAVSYIADDVNVLNDNNGSDDKLTASTCAMQYAFDGNTSSDPKCTFSSESNLTFASGLTYGAIDINVTGNSQPFEYLITPAGGTNNNRSTVLTNGLCTLSDFSTRVSDSNDSSYHVCPIDEDNATGATTTEDTLVQALNEGTDSIGAAVSDDVKNDVDQFKQDVLEANGRSINDANTTITIDDIIKYLNKNNK